LEQKWLAISNWQLQQCDPYRVTLDPIIEITPGIGHLIKIHIFERWAQPLELSSVLASQRREQPSFCSFIIAQLAKRSPRPREGLLHEIFCIRAITSQPVRKSIEIAGISVN